MPASKARRPGKERRSRTIGLRLFVAGRSPNSLIALASLKAMEAQGHHFDLEIVDVLRTPERALAEGILVTPTLVKLSPAPSCRIIGNLRDSAVVLGTLGLA